MVVKKGRLEAYILSSPHFTLEQRVVAFTLFASGFGSAEILWGSSGLEGLLSVPYG